MILVENIKSAFGVRAQAKEPLKGAAMADLPQVDDAAVLIRDGRFEWIGKREEISADTYASCEKIDARGGMVLPAFCDPHTHIVFAGWREAEFRDKIMGLSYEEIARNGGGILNSARRLQATSEDELFEQSYARVEQIMRMGTAAVEIKSGYGLTVADEIKMLRVIARIREKTPLHVKATFLGAHALPAEYKSNPDGYVDLIVQEMLPNIAAEKLADYVDVFCDRGFFTVAQTGRILEAAAKYGLKPKIHANELDYSGGIQVGVQHGAISVDHLECTGDEEIETLLHSNTIPTLLPSTAFFLGLPHPPARKMIQSGLPLALASDYNPGSSPSGSMPFIISLACIHLKMLPEEAINAATLNAAAAMEWHTEGGSLSPGKRADFIITPPISSVSFIPYTFTTQHIQTVFINGKQQYG